MLKKINLISVLLLFIWISFLPAPLQLRYGYLIKIILIFSFSLLLLRKQLVVLKPSDWPLYVFLAAFILNVFFSRQKLAAFLIYRDLAIYMFLVYYLVAETFVYFADYLLLAKVICLASLAVALGAILETIFAFNPIYSFWVANPFYQRYISGFVRPMSTQFNPCPLGTYLLASLPFNFFLAKAKSGILRRLSLINIVLSSTVIILTFSRSAFLGMTATIIFYLLMKKRFSAIAALLCLFLIFSFLCFLLPYPFGKLGPGFVASYAGTFSQYRLERLLVSLRMAGDHPFFGLGLGQFGVNFNRYFQAKGFVDPEIRIADNMYLTVIAETGIIGFLGFLLFNFWIIKKGINLLRNLNYLSREREFLLVALSAFLGILVNMAGYEVFYFPNQYIYYCLLIGILTGFLRNTKEGYLASKG